jgi:hypothetical protein
MLAAMSAADRQIERLKLPWRRVGFLISQNAEIPQTDQPSAGKNGQIGPN